MDYPRKTVLNIKFKQRRRRRIQLTETASRDDVDNPRVHGWILSIQGNLHWAIDKCMYGSISCVQNSRSSPLYSCKYSLVFIDAGKSDDFALDWVAGPIVLHALSPDSSAIWHYLSLMLTSVRSPVLLLRVLRLRATIKSTDKWLDSFWNTLDLSTVHRKGRQGDRMIYPATSCCWPEYETRKQSTIIKVGKARGRRSLTAITGQSLLTLLWFLVSFSMHPSHVSVLPLSTLATFLITRCRTYF